MEELTQMDSWDQPEMSFEEFGYELYEPFIRSSPPEEWTKSREWDWIFDGVLSLGEVEIAPEKNIVVDACDPWASPTTLGCFSSPSIVKSPDLGEIPEVQEVFGILNDPCESIQLVQNVAQEEDSVVEEGRLGLAGPMVGYAEEERSEVSAAETGSRSSNGFGPQDHSDLQQGTLGFSADIPSADSVGRFESYQDQKTSSPESGCMSPDDQVHSRSGNNSVGHFGDAGEGSGEDATGCIDEEARRKIRLMRNRESATQSRLRKKSYVRELEAKCRMLENHCAMLQSTVAFTSQENCLLRHELNSIKCQNVDGSMSGVVKPAALSSDSLPSESSPRRTVLGPSHLDNSELLACLYHALLLTLWGALPVERAREGKNQRNPWFQVKSREVPYGSIFSTFLASLGRLSSPMMLVTRKLMYFSERARVRSIPFVTSKSSRCSSTPARRHKHSSLRTKSLRCSRHLLRLGKRRRNRYQVD